MILSSTVESYFNDLIYRWGHPLDFHMLDILVWSSIILYHVYICIPTYRVYLYIVEKSLDSYIFNTFLCVESCTSSEKNTKGTLRLQGHEQPKHASVGNPVGFRGFWGFKTKVERDKHLSVQITIFHQPNFPWNQGISLPQLHFGEVAMIWLIFFQLNQPRSFTPLQRVNLCHDWGLALQDITKDIVWGGPRWLLALAKRREFSRVSQNSGHSC